jgi:tyrosinase
MTSHRGRSIAHRSTIGLLAVAVLLAAAACTSAGSQAGSAVAISSPAASSAAPPTTIASGSSGSATTSGSQAVPPPVLVRKNVMSLTTAEKAEFVSAVKKLKTTPAPGDSRVTNWYDHFVAENLSKLICWSHEPNQGGYGNYGPDLLTWHRAFLLEFQDALTQVAGHPMALPYWDWTDPASTAVVFADDFMGPGGKPEDNYTVTSGPFAKGQWALNVKGFAADNPGQFDDLVRATGTIDHATELPAAAEVQQALDRPLYDVAPFNPAADPDSSFRAFLGGDVGSTGTTCDDGVVKATEVQGSRLDATVLKYVGGVNDNGHIGSLTDTATAPNDPVFWLVFANTDRIAEAWWKAHKYQYVPESGGPNGTNINDVLYPYADLTNGSMVKPAEQLGYSYDTLPTAGGAPETLTTVTTTETEHHETQTTHTTPTTHTTTTTPTTTDTTETTDTTDTTETTTTTATTDTTPTSTP